MSCPGDLYVVPGAAPCSGGGGAGVVSLQGLDGALNLQSPTGSITITPAGTDINLDVVSNAQNTVTNSVSSPNNIVITATTIGTSQILATVQIITTAVSDINVTGNITITTNSNTQYNFTYYIEMFYNGVTTTIGLPCTSTINGVGHYLTCPIVVNTTTPPGNATFYLRAYANTASIFTVQSSELTAIGNLTKVGGTSTINAIVPLNIGFAQSFGGGITALSGLISLPPIDPVLNPYVTFQLTICGTGAPNLLTANNLQIGVWSASTPLCTTTFSGTPLPSVNWGTTIPNALNQVILNRAVTYAQYAFGIAYYIDLTTGPGSPSFYNFNNLQFQLTITYNV
jgi:hypothetical protein